MTIHDVTDVKEQFKAMDVRGQIVRSRKDILDELMESLKMDYVSGQFRSVVIHYRIFLHHAANAVLMRTIPDSKILAGQGTPSGTDTMKVQQALDGTLDPTPETRKLCNGLSESLHAIIPPPEDSEGLAKHLMQAAKLWIDIVAKDDKILNQWWDDLKASGITTGRFQPIVKGKKRNQKP